MIAGGPTMALATLRLPRRLTLVLALAVFARGHVVAALSSSFTVVLAARVVTAPATGAFWAVGFVIATAAAGPVRATRAVGIMMGGLTLANVVGVLIGSFVGQYTGWRGPFWALAVLAALAAADLIVGGVLTTYTYITPLLTDRVGIPAGAVPLVLIFFGLGALGGTAIGDRHPMAPALTSALTTSA
jgi:DHA1 family inner membrane transport protein